MNLALFDGKISFIFKKDGEFEEVENNTESSSFYETCKSLIRTLTALEWIEMKTALIETLETQVDTCSSSPITDID